MKTILEFCTQLEVIISIWCLSGVIASLIAHKIMYKKFTITDVIFAIWSGIIGGGLTVCFLLFIWALNQEIEYNKIRNEDICQSKK